MSSLTDNRGRARLALYGIVAVCIAALASLIALLVIMPARIREGVVYKYQVPLYDDVVFQSPHELLMQLLVVQQILFFVSIVFFCRWLFIANKNLHQAGHMELEYKPGWAVANFFIPIIRLFTPTRIMHEIWFGYHFLNGYSNYEQVPRNKSIGWWWVLYILSEVASRYAQMAGKEGPIHYTIAVALSQILLINTGILLYLFIRDINRLEVTGRKRLEDRDTVSREDIIGSMVNND
jgi:hypothetical protein